MSDDLDDAGNPEGVSRNDPTLPLFFNPAFAQVFEGRGDEPLARPGTTPQAAAAAPTAPAQPTPQPQFAAPDDSEGEEPAPPGVPFPQFPGGRGAPSGMEGEPGASPEPVAQTEGGPPAPPPFDAALLGQFQAQQAALAALLQSTERAISAVAERVGTAPAPAPAPPLPPDPAVTRMCERLGVEPDEFIAAISSVSGSQVAAFARALDENIRTAEQAQREFLDSMKRVDSSFDKATFDAFLLTDADAARTMQQAADKTAAGRIVWEYAKSKIVAPQGAGAPVPVAAAQPAQPVAGARAAGAPGASGRRVPALTDTEQRAARLNKLEEKTRDLGDEHPLSRNYFMARLFGSADERDFIDPRVARHGRIARPRPQA